MDLSGLSAISPLTIYNRQIVQEDARVTESAKDPQIKQATTQFEAVTISPTARAASKITTADQLLGNYKALQYVLTAYGLQDEIDAKGILKKVFTQDPSDSNSLVNQLSDPRWKALGTAINFANGNNPFAVSDAVYKTEQKYDQASYENALGDANSSLQEAAYFRRSIGAASSNIYSILGDKTLRDVVFTTLGIPTSVALQSVESQAKLVQSKLGVSLSKFTDSKFVDSFNQRYLATVQATQSQTTSANALTLIDDGSAASSIDTIIGSGKFRITV